MVNMMNILVVLYLMYSLCCTGLVDGLTITLNKNAVRNSDLLMFITTSTITSGVTITKPGGSSDNCAAPIGGPGLCSTTDLSQDLTTGVTTFKISSLVRSRDEGTWTASHVASDVNTIDIKVLTIPTLIVSQTVSALTLSSSNTQSLTITATCAYPAVSLDVYFVPTGGGTAVSSPSSTATCTSTGNAGCADTDAESYDCIIVPKLETSLTAGTYYVQFVVNLTGQYEPIGLNATITDTVITIEASSSICDSCTTTNAFAALGIVVAVVCVALYWKMYFKFSGQTIPPVYVQGNAPITLTCPADDQATTLTWTGPGGTLYVTGTTVEAGFSGSVKRRISASHTGGSYTLTFTKFLPSDMGIYTSEVNGTVDSQMVILEGQTIITPVYVQSNTTLTLTCPADDQATTLTWTGPGGIPYVTGTTVEAGLDDSLKSRVSASHTGGSYTLMFTEFRSSDMGIYTSEVDGIVDTQIVIVQDESTKLQEIIQQVNVCAFALVSTNKRKQKKSN